MTMAGKKDGPPQDTPPPAAAESKKPLAGASKDVEEAESKLAPPPGKGDTKAAPA